MKKFSIIILLCINICCQIIASPTDTTPRKVVQPNGDTISISFRGDEYGSWYEDMNGYIIDLNSDKYWTYVTIQNNKKELTNQIVTSTSIPININRDSVLNFIIQKRQESYQQRNNTNEMSARASNQNALLPSIGQQKILTILVQFNDIKFINRNGAYEDFTRMMNQVDYIHPGQSYITGSVRDYYLQASYNQLDIESTVIGPYTVSFNRAYYGANINNSKDVRVHELVEEVISMIINDIDLSPFDNNNDGWVDCVHILYAGNGENENDVTYAGAIWPHKGSLTNQMNVNGKKIKNYIMTPEKYGNYYSGIGTICHELCHAMGAPDFYDTNYEFNGEFLGTGNWDIMAGGSLNSYHPLMKGINPAHPNPYIKTRMFGWTSATELSGNNRLYTLPSSELSASSIYKLSTSTPNEYYLLENRQGKKLPGSGLVIYHISSDIEDYIESNTINIAHRQKLYVVAANTHNKKPTDFLGAYGNINSSGATFKDDITNNIFFTSQTLPSNCDWAENTTSNKNVCFIKEIENNGEKQITFVLNPEISGPDVLCDSAIYSLPHVPDSATIVWSYIRPIGTPAICTPLYIGTGQGTKNVCFRRGGEMRVENSGPGLEQPDFPWQPVSTSTTSLFTFIPYEGFITIKANITFNNETYTVTKKIYMPEKVEIDDQGMGFGNPWKPGTTKVITLSSPLNSEIVADILWEVDMVGGSSFTRQGGTSVVLTPTSSVTTISITATYLRGCDDETKTCTKVFPVDDNFSMSFANPASGNVEINILAGGETDSNMRTINNPEPYMGAYRLELWHDLYGKVREIDVAENTPTVTMNLDGLSSGVYVLRLIIDNQIITAEQLIVK